MCEQKEIKFYVSLFFKTAPDDENHLGLWCEKVGVKQ